MKKNIILNYLLTFSKKIPGNEEFLKQILLFNMIFKKNAKIFIIT